MAKLTAQDILVMLDEDDCMNEVITTGSDDEFEMQDRYYLSYELEVACSFFVVYSVSCINFFNNKFVIKKK